MSRSLVELAIATSIPVSEWKKDPRVVETAFEILEEQGVFKLQQVGDEEDDGPRMKG